MFESFNLSAFGNKLHEIRVSKKLTQQNVKEITGISEDTLRRIENGFCIPKYETLESLSALYKVDLLTVLQNNRKNIYLYDIYSQIDSIINTTCFNTLQLKSEAFINELENNLNYQLVSYQELQLLKVFLSLNLDYHNPDVTNCHVLIENAIDALNNLIPFFSMDALNDLDFNILETRILLLIGLLYAKVDDFIESNRLLTVCLNNLLVKPIENLDSAKLIIKVFFNLSYNYHRLYNYQAALDFSHKGLLYARERHLSYCTEYLLCRKAIAEMLLESNGYHETFKTMIAMIKFNGNIKLIDVFRESLISEYGIDLNDYL